MLKVYNLLSGDKVIGTLSINMGDKSKELKLVDNLSGLNEIPIHFYRGYMNGERHFFGQDIDEWIQDRVLPSGRQNIDEILRNMGLSEYNTLEIFIRTCGRHTGDKFRITEYIVHA